MVLSISGDIDYDSGRKIRRTMRVPCFNHNRAMIWTFPGKGATGYILSELVSYRVRKLKVSVNIAAKNLKFGMTHP